MLRRITESLPRKSAVRPVYNSPPLDREKEREREGWGKIERKQHDNNVAT